METGKRHRVDTTPPSEPAETREAKHDALVGRFVRKDFLDTVGRFTDELDDGVLNPAHIPSVFLEALGPGLQTEEGFKLLKEENPDFSTEEKQQIMQTSMANADFFAQQGDQRRAVEAERMRDIFIEWTFKGGKRGVTGKWGTEEIEGEQISQLRNKYAKGTAPDLKGYMEYVQKVEETDATAYATENARDTIEIFKTIKELGLESFTQALERMGMDRSLVDESAKSAKKDFMDMKDILNAKIAELVAKDLIPQDAINTYAAYSMAATQIDLKNTEQEDQSAQEIFTQLAQRENVSVPERSVLVLSDVNVSGGIAKSSSLAWIDENGKITVGDLIRSPKGAKKRQISHESAHALAALIKGYKLKSPLLAVAGASRLNEMEGTYGGCVSGEVDSFSTRLEAVRYALLNKAQLDMATKLDNACLEENLDEVASILKQDLTSQEIKDTFGKPVKGEGRGVFLGAFGVYAFASTVIPMVKDGITLEELILKTSRLPTPQAA